MARRPVSRRGFLSGGATLLASVGVATAWPNRAGAGTPSGPRSELAQYRPVRVSSTDYAPTPGQFAVDGLSGTGVRGTGWRAGAGDPQWIAVDLQAPCSIEAVTLTFEATLNDPPFDGNYGQTTGTEIRSSAATSFTIEVSSDGSTWTQVYATDSGTGGVLNIALPQPVTARWVRLTSTKRANANPVGLNGLQVYGTTTAHRPSATGWTDWSASPGEPAPALGVAADGTVPIQSGWRLTLDDFAGGLDGAVLSGSTVPPDVPWTTAVVPGTVLASLVASGHFPDPVGGFANLQIPEALSRHDWWYRREFTVPRGLDTGAGRWTWLEFDGINHAADVWLDGAQVGTVSHPFARAALDVTALLRARSKHSLAVRIAPMPHPGTPGDKSSDGNTFVQSGQLYLDSPTYLAASGWDWMPAVRDRVAGIWDHVRLRSTGPVVIGDPHIVTTVPSLERGTVHVVVPIRNASGQGQTVDVIATFGRTALRGKASVPAGATVDVDLGTAAVRDPELWWPNGYGDPTLHELRIAAAIGGSVSDTRTTRFGIREIGYSYDEPIVVPPSSSPTFVVPSGSSDPGQLVDLGAQSARYVRIHCGQRATQWGDSLWRLAVVDSAHPDVDLALHQTATASSDDGNPAGNAVDGDNTTRWSSGYQDDQWIQVDLGATTAFDQIQLAWEQAYALDFVVQISTDGAAWRDVKSVDNAAALGDSYTQTETFTAQTARYLRIHCGGRATQWGVSLWTLSAFSSAVPSADLALRKTAIASSDDGNPAPNAVDGNPRTRWSSAYQDGQWIQVDFGAPTTFDTVAIAWEQAYARDYVIQVSDDGSTWTDVKAVSNAVTPLRISVNGVPVFCRGGNWGWDELLRRTGDGRLETAVRMHRDMNFTMIRNWLGSSNRDELYRLCDENGILIWNDFWEAGAFNDDIPGYLDLVTDTIRRYRSHPCIAVWCGANEEVPPAHLDAGMRQAVADQSKEIIYISNSAGGIVSGHGPYHWVEPASYFDKNTYDTEGFGFHTEIGMPVVSVTESLQNLVGDEPGWPISEVWNYHDWSEKGNQQTGGYRDAIEARLGAAASLDEFCRRAQFVNYESSRAMFEAWNAHLWQDANGLLLWMSHPAWHSTVWQTYDYDLDVNGAYYGSRKGCEPVHVQANTDDWTVLVANHTPSAINGATVTATVYDLAGHHLDRRQQPISVPASDTATAFALPTKDGYPSLHLLRLELLDRSTARLSSNTYWRYRDPSDVQVLNSAPPTRLQLTVHSGHRQATATVTNVGPTVAAMVRLAVRDGAGHRVLPTFYSDNYLWLLPGESATVVAEWPDATPLRGTPRVVADAYNAPAITR